MYEKGVYNNGFGGYVKNLKTFLYWAQDKGYNIYKEFEKFQVYKEEPDIFPLNEREIKLFEEAKLVSKWDEVRDIFLFQVYTGLRISDALLITPSHYDSKNKLLKNYRAKKTGDALKIPLIKKATAILKKYNHLHEYGYLLPRMEPQTINIKLKEIAEKIGLTEDVPYYRKKGQRYEHFVAKRCEIITTHDGRRTFITQCLTKGMGAQMIMAITGHKNYKTFERYVRFSENDIVNQLNLVWNE